MPASAAATASDIPVFRPFLTPPPPRRGDPTDAPCIICGGDGSTEAWAMCQSCRDDKQKTADAAVKRLQRQHPDWMY